MVMEDKLYIAIVEKVILNGRHGPYAVARCEGLDIVTFSLQLPVWSDVDFPEPGMCILLSKVRKKRAGWRAFAARFIEPSDESDSNSNSTEKG